MNGRALTRQVIRGLLHQQLLGVLSTVNRTIPYTSLVAFAASKDDAHLYFVTSRNTRKFANIAANPKVSLLIHNSANRPEDFDQASAVTAIGAAAPVSASILDHTRATFLEKHPNLKVFVASSDSEMIDIKVESYILVEHFQRITEYRIDHSDNFNH